MEKSFLKNFPAFSIFYRFLSCPRCEREEQASFTTALGRREVIPFEIEPSGKRNRARKFCTYCIKVLHGEALNYLDELDRQREREVIFSELLKKDLDALYCCDDYDMADYFTVMGRQVPVRDKWISMALKKLPVKKREIILMLYFLNMTEKEIADCLKLVQSIIHYHKDDSLRLLRKLME